MDHIIKIKICAKREKKQVARLTESKSCSGSSSSEAILFAIVFCRFEAGSAGLLRPREGSPAVPGRFQNAHTNPVTRIISSTSHIELLLALPPARRRHSILESRCRARTVRTATAGRGAWPSAAPASCTVCRHRTPLPRQSRFPLKSPPRRSQQRRTRLATATAMIVTYTRMAARLWATTLTPRVNIRLLLTSASVKICIMSRVHRESIPSPLVWLLVVHLTDWANGPGSLLMIRGAT